MNVNTDASFWSAGMNKHGRTGLRIKQGLSEMRAVFESPAMKLNRSKQPAGPPEVPASESPPAYRAESPRDGRYDYGQAGGVHCVNDSPLHACYEEDVLSTEPRQWDDQGRGQEWNTHGAPGRDYVGGEAMDAGAVGATSQRFCTTQRNPRFNPEQAARELKHALDGKGCNEEVVINVLTDHNNAQRQEIKNRYRAMFGKELEKDLKKDLKGKLETVVTALLTPPREYLVQELRGAMKGLGTDEQTLIDILMPRTNREIKILKDTYKQVFGRDLEKDVHSETSGQFRDVMLAQLQANRDTSEDVMVAIHDAEQLTLAAREKKWDSDSVLYKAMFQRSYAQLRAIFKLYENATGQDIEDSIKQKTKGDLENSLIGLARAAKGIRYFYATRLYEAMKGRGMHDDVVIRTFVSRSEIDLARIAEEYQRLFHNSLSSAIAAETKGSYQTMLLRLLA